MEEHCMIRIILLDEAQKTYCNHDETWQEYLKLNTQQNL
jgi:hypothetical protein